jgi:tripartite-type tricarboxylate transporter receptor subunit TctC
MLAGTKLLHVPYKGTALATTDLLGGQIVMMFGSALGVIPHVRSKRMTAIALSTSRRTPALPDVPTASETIPGFAADLWYALFAPAGTPQDIIARLNRELAATLAETGVNGKLGDQGVDALANSPQEMVKMMRAEYEKWGKVVKATGVKIQ